MIVSNIHGLIFSDRDPRHRKCAVSVTSCRPETDLQDRERERERERDRQEEIETAK